MFGTPESVLTTVPHDLHRSRQKALLPYFSNKSVHELEPLIQSVIDCLCATVERHQRAQKPINLLYAFSAVTTDVISQYTFGESQHDVEKDDFAPEWYGSVMKSSELSLTLKQFGWLHSLMKKVPEWVVKNTNKSLHTLLTIQKVVFYYLMHEDSLNDWFVKGVWRSSPRHSRWQG